MNALDLALANAAANAPKGEELHLENLDSIADPSFNEPVRNIGNYVDEIRASVLPEEFVDKYNKFMQEQYENINSAHKEAYLVNDPQQDGLLLLNMKAILSEMPLIKLRLDALADMITAISTTITTAATMSSEHFDSAQRTPNHKHRSLHEWDDSTLLNELVERENDLMPFYFELLKRIGSPELQSLVMSSMQGKNNSMVTLAQLCSALAPAPIQPQPQVYQVGLSQSAEQRMDEAFHAATTPQTYTQAQLDNLRFNGQSSGITVNEITQYERMKRQGTVIPQGISNWDNSFPSR